MSKVSGHVPNGENTTSLGERTLVLHSTDAGFENGRNLGRGRLALRGVAADSRGNGGGDTGL